MKPKKILFISLKVTIFFIISLFIGINLISNNSTYAWFQSGTVSNSRVSIASEADLIENIYFDSNENNLTGENPEFITIKRKRNIAYNPNIYFGISGNVENYNLQINPANPIRFSQTNLATAEIKVNVTEEQYNILKTSPEPISIKGKIIIRCDNFINKEIEICFTKDYIINKFSALYDNHQKQVPSEFQIEPQSHTQSQSQNISATP